MPRRLKIEGDKYIPAAKTRTLCEVHREMYYILTHESPSNETNVKVCKLIEESYSMAKKMNAKLLQYKNKYPEEWYQKHKLDGDGKHLY